MERKNKNERKRLNKWKPIKKYVHIINTTNDNLKALQFYQKRGYYITRVYPNSMEIVRKLKTNIPLIGENGIPLRDEIELEKVLQY